MRIIAGQLKGRVLHETHGHKTHPMSEKIRGALYNALGDIEGLSVLDAFAGTGAVGIEALSRGAAYVQAIDQDKEAFNCVQKNIMTLNLQKSIHATHANISSWSDNNPDKQFDIVIADPPYDDVKPAVLQKVAQHVASSGVFILSLPTSIESPGIHGMKIIHTKQYGDAQLLFYKFA